MLWNVIADQVQLVPVVHFQWTPFACSCERACHLSQVRVISPRDCLWRNPEDTCQGQCSLFCKSHSYLYSSCMPVVETSNFPLLNWFSLGHCAKCHSWVFGYINRKLWLCKPVLLLIELRSILQRITQQADIIHNYHNFTLYFSLAKWPQIAYFAFF